MRLATLALGLVLAVPARADLPRDRRIELADQALRDWDPVAARWHADRLLEENPGDPQALLAASRVAFHESDYGEARRLADRALEAAADRGTRGTAEQFLAYLDERQPTWDAFEEHASDHFRLRVTPRDRILAPYALSALEAAARALHEELGYCPERPVVVEVHPSRRSFIGASTLTREEVETSGTVAICHFLRIMIMSPGVMARGYDWLDTLCHEYVHYAVYSMGQEAVPVWLHEGLAKVLESRWRAEEPEPLDPRLSSLLGEAREEGVWVGFEDMHPSMAKLPSASLVSLAFAEVATAVSMVRQEGGTGVLSRLVSAVRDRSGDLDAALMDVVGTDFVGFESRVREHAEGLDLYRIPGLAQLGPDGESALPFEFNDEGESPLDPEVEARQLEDRRARDWTMLGDRLKGRGYHAAAVIEYDKAIERLGHAEPLVVNRKAHALVLSGRLEEALPVLETVLRDHPTLTTTLDNLAEVHVRLAASAAARGRADESDAHAREALELALRSEAINPFNPDTHVRLAMLHERFGHLDQAEASRERLRILTELE